MRLNEKKIFGKTVEHFREKENFSKTFLTFPVNETRFSNPKGDLFDYFLVL